MKFANFLSQINLAQEQLNDLLPSENTIKKSLEYCGHEVSYFLPFLFSCFIWVYFSFHWNYY